MTKDLEKCWGLYITSSRSNDSAVRPFLVKKGVFEERGLPVKKVQEAGLIIHIDRKKENKGDLQNEDNTGKI